MDELNEEQVEFLLGKYTPDYCEKEYPNHYSLVFEETDEVLGVGLLIVETAEIRGLYVNPQFHGKGVGSRLLESLEKEAVRLGISKVHVKSYFRPESFYEKAGYKRIREGMVEIGKIQFPFVEMEKKLGKEKIENNCME
ncbi:MAG: GNAT family N-acetyltransferase [Candidatus Gracilibacteria bacterium]|nr:GNAT family N-acetyltransferase [Candidatus Gracilibacteria bacterium]